jgi:hypothetical protein
MLPDSLNCQRGRQMRDSADLIRGVLEPGTVLGTGSGCLIGGRVYPLRGRYWFFMSEIGTKEHPSKAEYRLKIRLETNLPQFKK